MSNHHRAAPNTLIFCTAHADDETVWDGRYRRWLDAVRASKLDHAAALIVDDGSSTLPDWDDVAVVREGTPFIAADRPVLYHFERNLGRKSIFDFPGWHRSFAFAAEYAERNGFDKIVHIESDSFVISDRLQAFLNAVDDGWIALWCGRHGFPEITIQVMAGRGLEMFQTFCRSVPHDALKGRAYEHQLPFTRIERGFTGDRYGEYLPYVPVEADYVAQAPDADRSYYWWMKVPAARQPAAGDDPLPSDARAPTLARHNEMLRFERSRLQAMIYGLQADLAEARHANEELRSQLETVRGSLSWRLTRPLRMIGRFRTRP